MPITCEIDHERRLAIAQPRGLLADGAMFAYQRELGARTEVSGRDKLIDRSDVSEFESHSGSRVSERAQFSSRTDAPGSFCKLAVVVVNDHPFGLGRMYRTDRELAGNNSKSDSVFRDRQAALDWLDLDRDPAQ